MIGSQYSETAVKVIVGGWLRLRGNLGGVIASVMDIDGGGLDISSS